MWRDSSSLTNFLIKLNYWEESFEGILKLKILKLIVKRKNENISSKEDILWLLLKERIFNLW